MASAMWSASHGVGFSKKHDAPGVGPLHASPRLPFGGFRRRRFIPMVVVLVALYFFIKNIPTDVPSVGSRYNPAFGSMAPGHVKAQYGQQQMKVDDAQAKTSAEQQYDGPVQFNSLAASLRPHVSYGATDNVLFLLPDLTSTAILVPVACQMARANHSSIHVVLLGRQDIGFEDVVNIHGITKADCPIYWHDATPDHALASSESRIEAAIQSGFAHCVVGLHPLVALIDDRFGVNAVVGRQLQTIAAGAGVSLKTLPQDVSQSLPWVTSLDASSLLKLRDIEIEIVIQAYSDSAGTLIRLLRSIEGAYYRDLHFPKITIELPAKIDPFVTSYLEGLRWPPGSASSESRLILRHRLNAKSSGASEASLRTVETFFPRTATTNHVLLLSPDAELAPGYFQYLLFTLLEYRYGQRHQSSSTNLFGISLELPEKKLDGQEPFLESFNAQRGSFLLSQTPTSNALLVLGDKWSELHSFLSERLARDPDLTQESESAATIASDHPHWLTEVADLMQIGGQYILYPAFAVEKKFRLITLHEELHQGPEEYIQTNADKEPSTPPETDNSIHKYSVTGDAHELRESDNTTPLSASLPMDVLLPYDKGSIQHVLPLLAEIPLYTFTGEPTDWSASAKAAVKFAERFSLHQGGCSSPTSRDSTKQGSINYFFCD